MKAVQFIPQPRFFINTESQRSWKMLRYITRGPIDMNEVSVKSVQLYFSELVSDWRRYCYLLDVVAEILLWRGRLHFTLFGKDKSIWCPCHSIVLFASALISMERPELIPSVFFYGVAYCLLWNNYYASHHPSPWRRVRSYRNISGMAFLGWSPQRVSIPPGVGEKEDEALYALDMYKTYRVTGFLYELIMGALKVYRIYSKNTPMDISTVKNSGTLFSKLYVNYLHYVHTLLRSKSHDSD